MVKRTRLILPSWMVSLVLLLQIIVVSPLIDIIAYTIFDTCSRTFKAIEFSTTSQKTLRLSYH